MFRINPLLESDFYKQVHWNQYPENTGKVISYFTPRMTRIPEQQYLIMFGLQSFIKEFLIEDFNEFFFNRPREEVMAEAARVLGPTIGLEVSGIERYGQLHDLGYLPLLIRALPEGEKVPIGVPMFEISNTHPDFAWLTNAIESVISCEMWHAMVCANNAYEYRQIVNKWYNISVDDNIPRCKALGDFSMRGQESKRSAYKSSAAWLLSFANTATVPAIPYLEHYYNCDASTELVGLGAVSTEHSVMCSNYSVDGDEITGIKRLLKLYKNIPFSMVSDSYDYWHLVRDLLPQLKDEIIEHNAKFLIRGDSGRPTDIVVETVVELDKIFGHSINSKGYKILPPYIGVIYGDGWSKAGVEEVYSRLTELGYAANNAVMGVGSMSMQCVGPEGGYGAFTRDTFGIAIKATHMITKDGKEYPIFKNPKECSFKKSQKGCCIVYFDPKAMKYTYYDNQTWLDSITSEIQAFEPVFCNGIMITEYSLKEIRDRLHKGAF